MYIIQNLCEGFSSILSHGIFGIATVRIFESDRRPISLIVIVCQSGSSRPYRRNTLYILAQRLAFFRRPKVLKLCESAITSLGISTCRIDVFARVVTPLLSTWRLLALHCVKISKYCRYSLEIKITYKCVRRFLETVH